MAIHPIFQSILSSHGLTRDPVMSDLDAHLRQEEEADRYEAMCEEVACDDTFIAASLRKHAEAIWELLTAYPRHGDAGKERLLQLHDEIELEIQAEAHKRTGVHDPATRRHFAAMGFDVEDV